MPLDDRSWATFVGSLDDATKRRLVQYVAGLNQAEARAYQPSMRDRLGAAIAGDSRPGDVRYNLAQGIVGSAGVGGSGIGLGDFTPAGIPMAASDAAKFAREGDYVGAGLSAAGVVAPGLKSGRAAMAGAANAAGETAKGIRAYHGSPHDFDRFSLDKIGTGEGAQAYGHGLYFAESEGVAKSYRDTLSGKNSPISYRVMKDGKELPWHEMTADERRLLPIWSDAGGDLAKAKAEVEKAFLPSAHGRLYAELDRLAAQRYELRPHGNMYEVNIRANPDELIDWDAPIASQSDRVKAAASKFNVPENEVGESLYRRSFQTRYAVEGSDGRWGPGGATREESLAMVGGDPKKIREVRDGADPNRRGALLDEGIKGVRYLDAGSRSAGDGSRNYVVFDDSLIEILRKYGLLAPIGAAAAGSALLGDAEAERY